MFKLRFHIIKNHSMNGIHVIPAHDRISEHLKKCYAPPKFYKQTKLISLRNWTNTFPDCLFHNYAAQG